MSLEKYRTILEEYANAEERFIAGAVLIGGHTLDTYNAILYYYTGYRDLSSYLAEELNLEIDSIED